MVEGRFVSIVLCFGFAATVSLKEQGFFSSVPEMSVMFLLLKIISYVSEVN